MLFQFSSIQELLWYESLNSLRRWEAGTLMRKGSVSKVQATRIWAQIPQHLYQTVVVHICNLSSGVCGCRNRRIPGAHWLPEKLNWWAPGSVTELVAKTTVEWSRKILEVNFWPPYTCTHKNIHKKMTGSCLNRTQTPQYIRITDHEITFKPHFLWLGGNIT